MYDQLHHAFQSELSLNMSGSLKHHSCCFALLKMSENWRKSQDKRKAVVAVAIDLAKHLTQSITVYCWLNLAHMVSPHRPCSYVLLPDGSQTES